MPARREPVRLRVVALAPATARAAFRSTGSSGRLGHDAHDVYSLLDRLLVAGDDGGAYTQVLLVANQLGSRVSLKPARLWRLSSRHPRR